MMRRTGFTLVEMLVALFIFGLLAAAGVTVMSYAVDSQTQVRAHMDRTAEFQRMRAIIKADLAQAATRRTRGLDGQPAPYAMTGGGATEGTVLILTRRGWENVDGRPRASLQYVEYRVVDERLERSTRPALDGAPVGPPQVVYAGVTDLQLAFLSRGRWTTSWLGEPLTQLPDAVRLEMTLEGVGAVTQLFAVPAERPR